MNSLRRSVVIGAGLWTLGLMAAWATAITLHPQLMLSIRVVHSHGNLLFLTALATGIVGFFVVRAGLAPFAEMGRRLADVRKGAERRLLGRYPAEIAPLVADLNALLDQRDDAVRRALAKAGDLAHGLKTPLAVLAQEAERAAAAGHTDLSHALQEQIERMRRQIEYHLAHSRAASGAAANARCSVLASAEPLARTLLRLHSARGIAIDVVVPADHEVRCQREDLDEMLGNLLDNACKWAKGRVVVESRILPPEGGRHTSRAGGSHGAGGSDTEAASCVEITVDDDGPGLARSMWEAVLQRGVRADEAAPGTGFGLTIVRDLTDVYGGAIALDRSPAGGLRARLRLPAAR
jgi:signal transduction histidine kinase